jgi:type IX secretion system PorP/SprF family membrane protein
MKKILALIGFVMMGFTINAQQDLLLSQQFFSRINKNPAGTGNVTDLDLFLLGHYKYIEIKDAPKSGIFNVQTFAEKINSGFGLSVSYDNIGVARSTTNAKLAYAYTISLRDEMILSLGLGGGIQYSYFDPNKYTWDDPTEMGLDGVPDVVTTELKPDFDFGVELTTPRFLLGLSATHIINNKSTTFATGRHFYGYVRYMFPLNESFELAPALAWMHKTAPSIEGNDKFIGKGVDVAELNLMAFYERFIWGGLTYHPDIHDKFKTNPVGITLGIEYREFRIGYTFDWAFGATSRLSGNAQELMLSYSVQGKKKTKDPIFE